MHCGNRAPQIFITHIGFEAFHVLTSAHVAKQTCINMLSNLSKAMQLAANSVHGFPAPVCEAGLEYVQLCRHFRHVPLEQHRLPSLPIVQVPKEFDQASQAGQHRRPIL